MLARVGEGLGGVVAGTGLGGELGEELEDVGGGGSWGRL